MDLGEMTYSWSQSPERCCLAQDTFSTLKSINKYHSTECILPFIGMRSDLFAFFLSPWEPDGLR